MTCISNDYDNTCNILHFSTLKSALKHEKMVYIKCYLENLWLKKMYWVDEFILNMKVTYLSIGADICTDKGVGHRHKVICCADCWTLGGKKM